MLTHQAIFFFRRNKNNNSNDRRFALSSRFFSLFLSRSIFLYVSPVVLLLLPIVIRMTFFFFFSQHRSTRIRIFDQSNHLFCRSSPRRERMCVCMYVYVCLHVCCCCCFWQVTAVLPEKKKCVSERERAYQALSSFATWFIDKSIKMYIHIWQ